MEAGDYLEIGETAERSHLAAKTLYNWINIGRIGAGEGVCHLGRKLEFNCPPSRPR